MSTKESDWSELANEEGLDTDTITARRITSVGTPCLLEQAHRDRTCYVQLWYNGNDIYEVRWCRPAGVDETCLQPQYGSRSFSLADLKSSAPGWFDAQEWREDIECKDDDTLAEWNIDGAIDQYYTLVTELGL